MASNRNICQAILSGAGRNIGSLTRVIVGLTEEGGAGTGAEAVYDAIMEWATNVKGMELYAAQEEAIMELVSGASVVLTTPTGSGKTLVATAAIAAATARGDVGRAVNTPQRTPAPRPPLISTHILSLPLFRHTHACIVCRNTDFSMIRCSLFCFLPLTHCSRCA